MMGFAKTQPERFFSIVGIAVGAIAGFCVGGVGIAAGGSASGVPALAIMLIFAFVAGLVGNRLGIAIGRRRSR
jgi:hypothetical protein